MDMQKYVVIDSQDKQELIDKRQELIRKEQSVRRERQKMENEATYLLWEEFSLMDEIKGLDVLIGDCPAQE